MELQKNYGRPGFAFNIDVLLLSAFRQSCLPKHQKKIVLGVSQKECVMLKPLHTFLQV